MMMIQSKREPDFLQKNRNRNCLLCPIFILPSLESNGGAIFWTNLHLLSSCSFPSFPVVFRLLPCYFLLLNLLLVRSHQAQIFIVKRLIQGRNNVSIRVGDGPKSRDRDHTVAVKTAL